MWHHPKYYEEMEGTEGAGASSDTSRKEKVKMSIKRQATSDKRLSKKAIKIHEAWCIENGYLSHKQQATSFRDPDTRVLIIQSVRQIVAVMI
jgi:hypothetical protein